VVDAAYVPQRDLLSPQLVIAGRREVPNEETSEQGETCAALNQQLMCDRLAVVLPEDAGSGVVSRGSVVGSASPAGNSPYGERRARALD
jgi:hypothetical protein